MEIFKNAPTTYANRANAAKKAKSVDAKLGLERDPSRWVIAVNEDGRFFPVFIGNESFDAIHEGVCVAN